MRDNRLEKKSKQVHLIPIGCDRVARSYSGCSGLKIGAFREYIIRACYLNLAGKVQGKAGMKDRVKSGNNVGCRKPL